MHARPDLTFSGDGVGNGALRHSNSADDRLKPITSTWTEGALSQNNWPLPQHRGSRRLSSLGGFAVENFRLFIGFGHKWYPARRRLGLWRLPAGGYQHCGVRRDHRIQCSKEFTKHESHSIRFTDRQQLGILALVKRGRETPDSIIQTGCIVGVLIYLR